MRHGQYLMQLGLVVENANAMMPTCDEMRRVIFEQVRDSALIHNVMLAADYRGLSGEDRYTTLAYQALIALEQQYRVNMEHLNRCVKPMQSEST